MRWEKYNFSTFNEFTDWKDKIEEDSTASFVKTLTSSNTTHYLCHRTGNFKTRGAN